VRDLVSMAASATQRCRVWPKTAAQDVKCVWAHCSKHSVKMQWVVNKCLNGSVDLKSEEPPLKLISTRGDSQHRETRKWLLKLE